MKLLSPLIPVLVFSTALAAPSSSVLGEWHTPSGSIIRVEPCAAKVCLSVEAVPPGVPTHDVHNPRPALRGRLICGMVIGHGFTLENAAHATGGTLYDPRTGKTYHGEMTAQGNELRLRGYVGIPLFGLSQTWTRVTSPVDPCRAAAH